MTSKGNAQTVLGTIDPKSLGVTLVHEHLLIDMTPLFQKPKDCKYLKLAHEPLRLETLGWVRNNPMESYENIRFDDEKTIVEETIEFKALGGSTIVDLTPPEIGRDVFGLQRIARLTGLNVVCGTAHHSGDLHPKDMSSRSVEDITNEFVNELTHGIADSGARAGIIGEIGNSWPWLENERKCCIAAAKAMQVTGASAYIHPGRNCNSPLEILGLLKKEGADLERVVMGHLENRVEVNAMEAIADYGCYLGIDGFGYGSPLPPPSDMSVPSDQRRIKIVAQLIEKGYARKILLSGDISQKCHLKRYGGYGYAHLLENIVPRLRREGVSDREIDQMLVDNPKRLLTLV